MATNDFLTFAGDPAANVMTQANYIASGFTARLLGFSTGTALSIQLNKVWRQASIMSHMIGQFTTDEVNQDMLDDGSPGGLASLQAHFRAAVTHVAQGAIGVGYLPLTGGSLSGPLTINAANALTINAPAGQSATVSLARQPGQYAVIVGYSNANPRWQILLPDNAAEVGANAGSNLDINSFTDAGAYLDTPMSINRATGVVNFSHSPTVNGALLPYLPIVGGTLTGNLGVGGVGINYPQMGGIWANHRTAFGWDNTFITAAVDGTYIGQLATVSWAQTTLGGYLPLTGGTLSGGLTINAGLIVASPSGFRSTVWFANVSDFINWWDGRTRFRQWAGSWWDGWDGQTGNRTWYCAGGQSMFLDGIANFQVTGAIRSYGARILSISGATWPSLCAYWTGGVAVGLYATDQGMWLGNMDGAGNPTSGHVLIDNGGYMTILASGQCNGNWYVGGSLHGGNIDTGGQISCWQLYASYSQIWGNETVNGQFLAGGQIISNSNVIAHQSLFCDNNLYCAGTSFGGYIRSYGNVQADGNFTGGGIFVNYVRSYGDSQTDGNLWCWNHINANGGMDAGGDINAGGNMHCNQGRIVSSSNGQPSVTAWSKDGNRAMCFYCDWNGMGQGGADGSGNPNQELHRLNGSGSFWNVPIYAPSDRKFKRNIGIAEEVDSLAAISRTPIAAFDWAEGRRIEHGLLADDLAQTLPDSVVIGKGMQLDADPDVETSQYVDTMALVAHLFRAVRQLNDKMERLAHVRD